MRAIHTVAFTVAGTAALMAMTMKPAATLHTASDAAQPQHRAIGPDALDPLCDVAVLPKPTGSLHAAKQIIEAEYDDSEMGTGPSKVVTITIDLWGKPQSTSNDATLPRRFLVKTTGFLSSREWTSADVNLNQRGGNPHQLIIEQLDGDDGCRVTLKDPAGQSVAWSSPGRADIMSVNASSRSEPDARESQVKPDEGSAASARRDTFRIMSNGEEAIVYIMPPS